MITFKQFLMENSEPVKGAIGDEGALKYVVKTEGNKKLDSDKGSYALISNKTGKALKYSKSKPSQKDADDALKTVEAFKHNK